MSSFRKLISFTLQLLLKSLIKLYNKTSCYSYHWKDLRRLWFLAEKLSLYLIKANHNINRNYFHFIWIRLQNLFLNCIFWSYQNDFGNKIKIIIRLFLHLNSSYCSQLFLTIFGTSMVNMCLTHRYEYFFVVALVNLVDLVAFISELFQLNLLKNGIKYDSSNKMNKL